MPKENAIYTKASIVKGAQSSIWVLVVQLAFPHGARVRGSSSERKVLARQVGFFSPNAYLYSLCLFLIQHQLSFPPLLIPLYYSIYTETMLSNPDPKNQVLVYVLLFPPPRNRVCRPAMSKEKVLVRPQKCGCSRVEATAILSSRVPSNSYLQVHTTQVLPRTLWAQ